MEKENLENTKEIKPAKAEKLTHSPAHEEEDDMSEFGDFGENESFGGMLSNMLRAVGIRPGKIFGCATVLLIIGGVVVLFFFGGWGYMQSHFPSLPSFSFFSTPAPKFAPSADKAGLNNADIVVANRFGHYRTNPHRYTPPSDDLAFIFGGIKRSLFYPMSSTQAGLTTSYTVGFRGNATARFGLYVQNIAQIQNILNTDVAALLNAQKDRKPALDNLLQSLNNLYTVSQTNAAYVAKEIVTTRDRLAALKTQLAAIEKKFNTAVSQFLPQESSAQLDAYTAISKDQSEANAQLGAMTKINGYYVTAMVKLRARISDITTNSDALLKGVKVFDIKYSDIKIIQYDGNAPVDPAINAIDTSKTKSSSGPVNMKVGPQ